jgi:hypothetical protein
MNCRGTCQKYKAKWSAREHRYANGQKRCNTCEIFVRCEGYFCPCCGRILRTRPRSVKVVFGNI